MEEDNVKQQNSAHDHNFNSLPDTDEPPRKRPRHSNDESPELHDEDEDHKSNSGSPHPAGSLYRQPACQRCRSKKIKCDALSPQCTACKKAGESCLITNPTSHQEYQRGYVESLEDRVQQLQTYLKSMESVKTETETEAETKPTEIIQEQRQGIVRQNSMDGPVTTPKPTDHLLHARDHRYLGEGSGIGFINSILAAIRTRHTDINLLKSLLSNKKKHVDLKASQSTKSQFQQQHAPRPPHPALGAQLLATYLEKAQVKHPFVARGEVIRVCEGVLRGNPAMTSQDLFRAYMVFAIASVFHYRNGDSNKDNVNPMKYYAIAMQYIDHIPRLQSIDGVTNLLFIARLGFFCATGLSLWYIANLCLRICIENEMHLNPPKSKFSPVIPAVQEQMRRRVFWQCYSLDRHASQTLGRPFGIADEDIKVDLPVDVDDAELMNVTTDLSTFMSRRNMNSSPTSEMAFFLHNIKLKMITSRLNSELYDECLTRSKTPSSIMTTPGTLYMFLEKYIGELEKWRAQAPMSPPSSVQPTSQGFYTAEWHDLHLYQEKIALVRAIIDHIQPDNGYPPSDLLDMCFQSASQVIKLYQKLSVSNDIEPARGRLYRLFTAGITVLYCVLLSEQKVKDIPHKQQVDHALFRKQKDALKTCQSTLEFMAKPLIDDGSGLKYVRTFEVLCREVIRRVNSDKRNTHDRTLSSNLRTRQAFPENDGDEFGGASPPSGYEMILQQQQHQNEPSPHSANSWPMISDFAAGEIGEWAENGNGGGGGGGGDETLMLAEGNGVTGGYDYDIEGLGAEWANFLEILMDGRQ